jgi:hypothetical protein
MKENLIRSFKATLSIFTIIGIILFMVNTILIFVSNKVVSFILASFLTVWLLSAIISYLFEDKKELHNGQK